MATLGGGTATFGVGTGRVGWGVGVVATGGTGELGEGVMVGLGIQFVKMSRSFEMAVSCSWWMAAGASLIAHKKVEGVDDAVAFADCGFGEVLV